ncbi:RimJ/RimL family protein N-acetyltransferase [Acetoanaerobium pronyense]|uniref:RimJ/RimL family protein N-acetyltransferase n=1 Tax=Acetoanaerobium pronyense TaxID=1482736 RepID=A0ABS4KLY8_9FIRM|nr:hypothetical protein [Acetoanaerobium pronyense]MBP2028156.1 RimJ/RimL family protein N-acetyltransferase [Acetoanaerobium pronyense]
MATKHQFDKSPESRAKTNESSAISKKKFYLQKDNFLIKIPKKVLNKIYRTSFLYRIDVKEQEFNPQDFSFLPLDMKLLNKMASDYKEEVSKEKYAVLKDRIDPSFPDKTFVLLDGKKNIHGFCSMCFGDHNEDFLKIFIPASDERVYFFDGYIFADKRGSGSLLYMLKFCLNIAKDRGYRYATCMVLKENKASETNVLRAGFQRSGQVRHYILGKKIISKVYEWDDNKIKRVNEKISRNLNSKVKSM